MAEAVDLTIPNAQGSTYSDDEKREACALYVVHGIYTKVEELTGIPNQTLSGWGKQEWFQNHVGYLREQTKDAMVGKLERITLSALHQTQDRVDNGDFDKDGERTPMKGKDLATIAAINIDKRQILLAKPTSIRADTGDGMVALMEQFKKLAESNTEKVVSDQ